MRVPFTSSSASSTKLCVSLLLGAAFGAVMFVNPNARQADNIERSTAAVPVKEPLPSISAGTKYYAVSQDAKGRDDLEFDKKVTLFIEASQARVELLVATLESNPERAKKCANTVEGVGCSKLNSIMTDAVTSLNQAELAIESYQQKGVVADPVLARLQKQVNVLEAVNARYPGIGPEVSP